MKHSKSKITTPAWKEFEQLVCHLYELLGFKVTHDIQLPGQQCDAIAEKYIPAIGFVRLLIECKWQTRGSISNQIVQTSLSSFHTLKADYRLSKCVIVSNVPFSKDAKSIAFTHSDIELVSIAQLERQLLDVREISPTRIRAYETSKIFTHHVPAEASGYLPDQTILTKTDDLEGALLQWISARRSGLCVILGDYGVGKTTLLERLRYRVLKSQHTANQPVTPIIFTLRDFPVYDSLDSFILATIFNEYNIKIPIQFFWQIAATYSLALLLDGFDEISTLVNSSVRKQRFIDISPLLTTNSPTLLTCRPSYFLSSDEYNQLLTDANEKAAQISPDFSHGGGIVFASKRGIYEKLAYSLRQNYTISRSYQPLKRGIGTIELNLFDDNKVRSFLATYIDEIKSVHAMTLDEFIARLREIYDVRDLMSRPILMSMIMDTLLSGQLDLRSENIVIGPARLYELYTRAHLEWDWSKGPTRQALSVDERVCFSELVAVSMLKENSLEISFAQLVAVVKQAAIPLRHLQRIANDSLSEDEISTDIQYCNFLIRTSDKRFRFSHKSFMEFFVARFIKYDESGAADSLLMEVVLPVEILYFLGGFGIVEDGYARLLLERACFYYSNSETTACRNVVASIFFCGESLFGHCIEGGYV